MRLVFLLFLLAALAGCGGPGQPPAYVADCHDQKHPDFSPACPGSALPAEITSAPPLGWRCLAEQRGGDYRFAFYESPMRDEQGIWFDQADLSSGLVVSGTRLAQWDGASQGFVRTGPSSPASVTIYPYKVDLATATGSYSGSELDAVWTLYSDDPWLVYGLHAPGDSGRYYPGMRQFLAQLWAPMDFSLETAEGRIEATMHWGGGFGFGAVPPVDTCQLGEAARPLALK